MRSDYTRFRNAVAHAKSKLDAAPYSMQFQVIELDSISRRDTDDLLNCYLLYLSYLLSDLSDVSWIISILLI
jgi:hypothetical protein